MGVVNNKIALMGLEANTAGIMTSVTSMNGEIIGIKTELGNCVKADEVTEYSSLNLLQNEVSSGSSNGVTWVVNADKSITVSTVEGGATARVDIHVGTGLFGNTNFATYNNPPGAGGYRISNGRTSTKADESESVSSFYLAYNHTYNTVNLVVLKDTVIADPITCYPMVRLDSIEDINYEPGLSSNIKLEEMKLDTATFKSVVSGASDFAAFKTAVAAL